jgi:hypothetical protein
MTVSVVGGGLPAATFSVPLSVDVKDSVLAVAASSVGSADLGA